MKKPKKPLCEIPPNERIIGTGGDRSMINPKSRSFGKTLPDGSAFAKVNVPTPPKKKDDWTKLIGL